MFLRLCVVVSLFVVQGTLVHAQTKGDPFMDELTGYNQNLPKSCQIKSPAMRLAYACAKIQSPAANPKFYGTLNAGEPGSPAKDSNGVSFCYNSLVSVEKNGDLLRVAVLRDTGASANRKSYSVKQSNLKSEAGDTVLPLSGLHGECFGYGEAAKANCQSFMGLSDTNVDMAIKISGEGANNIRQTLTADRREIVAARRNGSQLAASNAEVNSDEAAQTAILFGRQQLLARAKEKMANMGKMPSPATGRANPAYEQANEAYRRCDEMIINMENSMKTPSQKDPEEEKLLSAYRAQLRGPSPGKDGAPASPTGGNGGGMREGVGGR